MAKTKPSPKPTKALAPIPSATTRALTTLKARATTLLSAWKSVSVTDTTSFEAAGLGVKDAVSIRKDLKALLDPEISAAKADLKLKQDLYKSVDNLLKAAEDRIRTALEDYARAQREAQAKLIAKALDKGNDVKAASLAAKPFVPDVAGLSFTEHWHAEVDDLGALIQAVAAGKVSSDMLDVNYVALNARARDLKSIDLGIPGVHGVKETSSSVRS